jgi:CBS domain-containing protein
MAEKESKSTTHIGYYMSNNNLVTIDSDTTAFEIANRMLENESVL